MDLKVEIIRSNRKRSVGFSVRWPDTMLVTAPRNLHKNTVDNMIAERRVWAINRLNKLDAEYRCLELPKYFTGGEKFPYLGENYPLMVVVSGASTRLKCSLTDGRFIVEIPQTEEEAQPDLVRKAINLWYRRRAEEELRQSVERWAREIGKIPSSTSVRNQRSRWGSCSRRGAISFNWRLILLPPDLLDYVVVHELLHMIEPNHSPHYWKLVAANMPDYKNRRKDLKKYAAYLDAM